MVNQGDLVNVTLRNTDDMAHGFALAAYGLDVMINSGSALTNGTILPENTVVSTFKASIPGIFEFFCTVPCGPGHSEMVGTFVVLPAGSNNYNAQPASQYEYLTIKPDFAGVGYDKYIPGSIFVNQNDIVNIKLRNTDEVNHGFAMPSCGVNDQIVPAANMSSNGTLLPTDTFITEFFATIPGIHEFYCTNNCGAGHDQMIGYMVVMPTLSAAPTSGPQTQPASPTMSLLIFAALSIALLIAGILIGIIIIKNPKNST